MNKEQLYSQLKDLLENKIQFLNDKPEETVDSTLKALWLSASGKKMSSEEAVKISLPDLTQQQENILKEFIDQRLTNIPLAHITNRQNFMGIELLADKRALIPRKETEILGRKALELSHQITAKQPSALVIDVCCGSGNLGLAVASYNPKVTMFATDISHDAVELTRQNIDYLDLGKRVKAFQGDFLSAFDNDEFYEKVDLLICNPPYITSTKVGKMPSEISLHEPSLAFDGGMMGIKILQRLKNESPKFLKSSGWVVFEVGAGQGPFIKQLFEKTGSFTSIGSVNDDSGTIRSIFAQKK